MEIKAEYKSGSLLLHMSGDLDHHGARSAMGAIDGYIDELLPRDTTLEMSGVTFMDSSGIALILKAEKRMREMGGRCFVQDPGRQALRVIDASGIDRLVPIKGEQAI